ncbi:MAG: paraquat-inducible protein A [Rhodobacteraceae bacterium]|nr:paraquat-inducible protein A [Paracoccaceae bacterium]
MSKVLALLNLALLIAFPVAWAAPILRAGVLPFFGMSEISVLSGIRSLLESDPWLALLVALLALVAPYVKILTLAGIQFGYLTARALPLVKFAGRLAMADIFLIALYIVVVKGAGLARVETAWGLWLFTACVGLSLITSWLTPVRR